ncbi:hypothetical protein GW17_00005749 [Ensete ventricosum]|nr:hypothetical protein GW17_00005749 [Ensete ventricosum]
MYGSIFSSTFSNIIELLEIQLLTFGLNVFIYVFVCVTSKGIKVEGILRQSADVEEVKRRVREYEQGMFAFIVYNTISYHSVCSVCTSPIEDQYARYLSLPCYSNSWVVYNEIASLVVQLLLQLGSCPMLRFFSHILPSDDGEGLDKPNKLVVSIKRPAIWGRTPVSIFARKNLSMESIDLSEDEYVIYLLTILLFSKVKGNAVLQESLQRRKEVLHERRLALEQDVSTAL